MSNEASATPKAPATFTATASASPTTVAPGASTTVTLKVTDTSGTLSNGNVQMQIYNSGGTAVVTNNWTAQTFALNQQITYTYKWTVPSTEPAGAYTVKIGVFDSSWNMLYWNNGAATITVN
jgi:hypothetical protein